MSDPERGAWVSLLDSDAWRRASRSRLGTRVLKSERFKDVDTLRRRAVTRYKTLRNPARFSAVETFCVFIGHVKSGGTLLGSMLDAHPDALVSDEVDVLRFVEEGFTRDQLFHLVEKGSQREAMKGRVTARRLGGYSLEVPGQWQGRARDLRMLGDVRSGPTTRRLGVKPALLDQLDATLAPVAVRFVHVVRDPFDPISAMVIRGKRTIDNAIDDYRAQCVRLQWLRETISPNRLHTVRYDELVARPQDELQRVCAHLALTPRTDHLTACADLVDPTRPGEREDVDWDDRSVARVTDMIASTPFLTGYRWA